MTYTAEQIAPICHAAGRALQQIQGDPSIPVSPKWEKLDAETRQSITEGVANIMSGKVTSPQMSHIEWCKFKEDHGWVYGEVKDGDAKTHPCLVPYERLSQEMKDKDALFFAVVRALAFGVIPQLPGHLLQDSFEQGARDGG